ncbi:MAG: hypothetical protein ACRBN8_20835 [Nannocystales bacterium]
MKTLHPILFAGLLVGTVTGCDDAEAPATEADAEPGDPAFIRDPALDVDNISAADESKSHNAGMNCMQCHQSLGAGLGQFTVAGTLYGPDDAPVPNATLELWTAPERQGELVTAIEADAYGNVFSTEPLPFPEQRLFVWVESEDASLSAAMPFPTASGSCNHCHAGGFKVRLEPPAEDDGESGE